MPPIQHHDIDMPATRKREMRAYSKRHYGYASASWPPARDRRAHRGRADVDGGLEHVRARRAGQRAGRAARRLLALRDRRDGRIIELVPPRLRCRHTVGLNTSRSASSTSATPTATCSTTSAAARLAAPHRLAALPLRHRGRDVIGHSEASAARTTASASSACEQQTHGDWSHASMKVYRRRLARKPCEATG